MHVLVSTGACDPGIDVHFQLKSQVQEHILDYLNQFKKGSLIGAVTDPRPAMKLSETATPTNLDTEADMSFEEKAALHKKLAERN